MLVGPNNSGKSTIIGSLKILFEGLRKAKSKKPINITSLAGITVLGYEIDLKQVPVATENVFYNYEEDVPAVIKFELSNGGIINIFFPQREQCFMYYENGNETIKTAAEFKLKINLEIGFVPILGPVDHKEKLYQKEAARLALLTYTASRNFRNIWHHYDEDFPEFKELIKSSWPGMDIDPPEVNRTTENPTLDMFCPEERIPRELFWAGFGFQVWCQMLTFIVKYKNASLFLIDEPDIYLHSDLQRQLLAILKNLGPDIILATHSTELISEADINDILVINKAQRTAKRIKDPTQLREIFNALGSNLNPLLTQIAKSKRVLFVEGKDFSILSKFARILKNDSVANRQNFAVVPVEGFNPSRLRALKEGIEKTIGTKIVSAVIFDRDYKSQAEIDIEHKDLIIGNYFAQIHSCKEIENFILVPEAIELAINNRVKDINKRSGKNQEFKGNVNKILDIISTDFKFKTQAQIQSHRFEFDKSSNPHLDKATVIEKILSDFDKEWTTLEKRLKIIPGKDFLAALNTYLQKEHKVTITTTNIINAFKRNNVSEELSSLIDNIELFRCQPVIEN